MTQETMVEIDKIKVLDQCQISPPAGSVPTTSLPLTFFDIPWLLCPHMQRLFFYEYSHSTHDFINSLFHSLKHSLSLTLRHFFPFAANLICPPPPQKPHILYTETDYISLTVVEASGYDFQDLIANYARDARDLHDFVPKLPQPRVLMDGTRVLPLMAIHLTVFPNDGISIGIEFCHAASDGSAFHHFIKSWASICSTGDSDCLDGSLPFLDRTVIKDPNGVEAILLKQWWSWASKWNIPDDKEPIHDALVVEKVRATFVFDQAQIEGLKQWISTQIKKTNELEPSLHVSSFVATCSLIWVCLIKSTESEEGEFSENDELYNFVFVADCRNRLEFQIPTTYFGNCLDICIASVKRSQVMRENGILAAVKAIGNRVGELGSGALKRAEKWLTDWKQVSESGHFVTVAGSPRLGTYDTDFGWGRPIKSEVVQIDATGAISIGDSRYEKGGIEVGLALSRTDMERFNSILGPDLSMF